MLILPQAPLELRLTDQIQFLAETQSAICPEMYLHYRAIGSKQLINSSNLESTNVDCYGCKVIAESNICNTEGLPASSFNSDDWERLTQKIINR
jgi:hypothetical protein